MIFLKGDLRYKYFLKRTEVACCQNKHKYQQIELRNREPRKPSREPQYSILSRLYLVRVPLLRKQFEVKQSKHEALNLIKCETRFSKISTDLSLCLRSQKYLGLVTWTDKLTSLYRVIKMFSKQDRSIATVPLLSNSMPTHSPSLATKLPAYRIVPFSISPRHLTWTRAPGLML